MNFLIDYTHCWYDGLNDVHECGLKAEYYLEGIDDTDFDYHF